MKNLFFLFLIVSGCAVSPKTENASQPSPNVDPVVLASAKDPDYNYDKLFVDLDSVNQKARADLIKLLNSDLTTISKTQYFEKLRSYKSRQAKNVLKQFKRFEKLDVTGSKRTFVFCAYSAELGISLCDDSRCMGIERIEYSKSNLIEKLKENLPLEKCG